MKKFFIALGILLVLVIAGLFTAPYFLPAEGLVQAIQTHVKAALGRELTIKESRVVLVPWPKLVLEQVSIEASPPGAAPFFSADKAEASLDLLALIQGDWSVSGLDLTTPRITMAGRTATAGGGAPDWLVRLEKDPMFNELRSLALTDGSLLYPADGSTPERMEWRGITDLNAEGGVSLLTGTLSASLQGKWNDKPVEFSVALAKSGKEGELNLTLRQDATKLAYQGKIAIVEGYVRLNGMFNGETNDIWPWLHVEGAVPSPASWKAQVTSEPALIRLQNIEASLAGSQARGGLELRVDPALVGSGKLHFPVLDVDQMLVQLENARGAAAPADAPAPKQTALLPFLPPSMEGQLLISADVMKLRQHEVKKFEGEVRLMSDELNINRAAAKFPGNSQLSFLGIIKRRDGRPVIEGQMEGAGTDLYALLKMLPVAIERFPARELKRFRAKANLFFSDKQARISEGQLLVEKTYLTGAVVAFLAQQPQRYEAVLRAQNIDLDAYIAAYRAGAKPVLPGAEPAMGGWQWLKDLPYEVELNAQIHDFILQDMNGQKAAFKLQALPGVLEIKDLAADLEQSNVGGSLRIEPRGALPWVKADLRFSRLPASALLTVASKPGAEDVPDAPKEAQRWSGETIDFSRLKGWNGEFDLAFGTLVFPKFEMGNVKLKGALQNAILNIQELTAALWQGTLKTSGTIDVSDIPKIQGDFVLQGVDAAGLLGTAFDIDTLSGKLNANGNLGASGLSPRSWISSAHGGFGVAGRKIRVKGFDLPRVARGIGAVRSVADIVNVARLAFQSGETEFDTLQGDIYLESGVARTNGLKVTSEQANGSLTGTLNLPAWQMDLNSTFTLRHGEEKEPPVLGVRFAGPADDTETTFDTSLLEAYIAKKAAERLLE